MFYTASFILLPKLRLFNILMLNLFGVGYFILYLFIWKNKIKISSNVNIPTTKMSPTLTQRFRLRVCQKEITFIILSEWPCRYDTHKNGGIRGLSWPFVFIKYRQKKIVVYMIAHEREKKTKFLR